MDDLGGMLIDPKGCYLKEIFAPADPSRSDGGSGQKHWEIPLGSISFSLMASFYGQTPDLPIILSRRRALRRCTVTQNLRTKVPEEDPRPRNTNVDFLE
jgi:hypothetical protein